MQWNLEMIFVYCLVCVCAGNYRCECAYGSPAVQIEWRFLRTPNICADVLLCGCAYVDAICHCVRTLCRTRRICMAVLSCEFDDGPAGSPSRWTFCGRIRIRTDVRRCACDNAEPNVPAPRTFSCTRRIGMDPKKPLLWWWLPLGSLSQPLHQHSDWLRHAMPFGHWLLSHEIWCDWCAHSCCQRTYCIDRICIAAYSMADVPSAAAWSMWPSTPHSSPLVSICYRAYCYF